MMLAKLVNFFWGVVGLGGRPRLPALPAAVSNSFTDFSQYFGAGSDGAKWPGGLSRSGAAPILNHSRLRINARSAYHNSLQARAVVERHTDTVIDSGLRLNSTPDPDILGITPEAAEAWASEVEAAFDHWARNRKCTLAENMNFYQSQRLAGICQQRDGEYFVRLTYSARTDLLNPLQLSFVDPGQIRGAAFTSTYGFMQINRDGIDRDGGGKELAYNIALQKPDFTYKFVKIPAVGPRSKRRMFLHGYQPEYPGQGRGYSRLSHALQEFENITDYSASELKKAIAQSSINMWVKPSKENVSSNPFEAIAHPGPAGPTAISESAQQLAEDNNIDPAGMVNYIEIPEATISNPGSVGVFNLNEGEELKAFSSTSPAQSFEGFVNCIAGHLSASLSIPLEVVLMKFEQNYSASRAALILFWRIAQIWRNEMASDFLNPVYENWLAGEIGAGRISAPGWTDPRLREAWVKNNWVGVPMPNIDPQKTAKSDQLYVEMGAQTLDRVAQNLNGTSGKSNRAKLKRELAELPPVPWTKSTPAAGGGEAEGGASEAEGGALDAEGAGDESEENGD